MLSWVLLLYKKLAALQSARQVLARRKEKVTCTLRLILNLNGEVVERADPHIGLLYVT
jgi:hypothetical protein